MIAIREKTMPIAPEALVPNFDTKYASAILYAEVMSIPIIVGTANVRISFGIGVFIIFSY